MCIVLLNQKRNIYKDCEIRYISYCENNIYQMEIYKTLYGYKVKFGLGFIYVESFKILMEVLKNK